MSKIKVSTLLVYKLDTNENQIISKRIYILCDHNDWMAFYMPLSSHDIALSLDGSCTLGRTGGQIPPMKEARPIYIYIRF